MSSTGGQPRRYQSIDDVVSKLVTAFDTIKLRENVKPHEDARIKQAFELLMEQPTLISSRDKRNSYRDFLRSMDKEFGPQIVVLSAIGLGRSAVGGMKESLRLRLPMEIKKRKLTLTCGILGELAARHSSKVSLDEYHPRSRDQTFPTSPISDANEESLHGHSHPQLPVPESESSGLEKDSFESTSAQGPAQQQAVQETSSLSGRVFALTNQDVQSIVTFNHIAGPILMTEPYDNASSPFITIPIPPRICLHFGAKRQQVM